MPKLNYQEVLYKLFPSSFFLVHKHVGVLPVDVNSSGIVFCPVCAGFIVTVATSGLAGYLYYIVPFVLSPNKIVNTKTVLKCLNGICEVVGSFLMVLITVVKVKRKGLDLIVRNLTAVEMRFIEKRADNFYTKGALVPFATRMFYLWLIFLIIPLSITINYNYPILTLLFSAIHLYNLTIVLMFMRIVQLLSRGFMTLNDLVKASWFRVKHPSTEAPKNILQEISEIHLLLSESVKETCSFFEFSLLCIFTLYFLNLVINPHHIIQEVADANKSYLILSARICWLCFTSLKLVMTAWVCNQLTYHAKKTSFYVSCLLSLDLPPISRDLVKRTLLLINHRKVNICVFNIFEINLKIVTVMAGMAMTYLMVMIQLEKF